MFQALDLEDTFTLPMIHTLSPPPPPPPPPHQKKSTRFVRFGEGQGAGKGQDVLEAL